MEWNRSETLALALQECTRCHGMGLRESARGEENPCTCVFRAVFRACFNRFKQCVTKEKRLTRAELEYSPRGGSRITWGRKDEEYIADFLLVSRRYLTQEERKLFNYHFLLGADWKLCCRKLGTDRGTFFHAVYRIQHRLGRIFMELKPFALFPLDEYFSGRTENEWRPERGAARRPIPINSGHRLTRRIPVPIHRAA